jgi:glycosyltransferase involved in cell wall biosynthesis
VLFIAYHFPPHSGSSGYLRTLKFVRYLLNDGWISTVLSVATRAYERLDDALLSQIPRSVEVLRPFCLDAARDLSIKGHYPGFLALPDRWSSWVIGAIPSGLRAIRKHRTAVLISTYPIVSAVIIGMLLKRITGLPWIVDFRDSMTEPDYPRDPRTRRVCQWVEQRAVSLADRLIFTAPSARRMYLERYPLLREENCIVIHNGYDEADFQGFDSCKYDADGLRPVRLLHLGLLYPEERDPQTFFRALSALKKKDAVSASTVLIDLRASGSEKYYARLLRDYGIDDLVRLLPTLPYHDALKDAARADALLIFQDASCNHQIPAKLYEYLRLKKPILALTSRRGDTAQLLQNSSGASILDLKDYDEIVISFPAFLAALRSQTHTIPSPDFFAQFERRILTAKLARCLDGLLQKESINSVSQIQDAGAE